MGFCTPRLSKGTIIIKIQHEMSSVTLTYIAVRIVPQSHVTYGNTETPTTPPAITLTKKRVQNISVDSVKTTVAAKFLEVIERICCNCEGFIF